MKTNYPAKLASLVIVSMAGLTAKADLLQETDAHFGANSLTLDTRTGLTWLDLPQSLNLSYSQAEAATQPGGQFAGFRHATATEVLSLFNSAGFGEGSFAASTPQGTNVASLIALIGANSVGEIAGLAGTSPQPSAPVPYITYNASQFYVSAGLGGPGTLSYGLDTHYPSVGNWLVVVPEPSFGLMLAGAVLCSSRMFQLSDARANRRSAAPSPTPPVS